jgi:hypothetical protein
MSDVACVLESSEVASSLSLKRVFFLNEKKSSLKIFEPIEGKLVYMYLAVVFPVLILAKSCGFILSLPLPLKALACF